MPAPLSSGDEIPTTFELTDMVVKEVSVVDRPANRRPFLIVKNAVGKVANSMQASQLEEVIDLADTPRVEVPGAELDRADVARQGVASDPAAELDRADAVAKAGAPRVPPQEPAGAKHAPDVRPVPADAASTAKAEEPGGASGAGGYGPIHPSAKKAYRGALGAVSERLSSIMAKVDASPEDASEVESPEEFVEDLSYLYAMLCAVQDLTGPGFEVGSSAVAEMAKAAGLRPVTKIGRPMARDRMKRLKAAVEVLADLVKELEPEGDAMPDAAAAKGGSPSVDVENHPAVLALKSQIANLSTLVKRQAALLDRAQPSNAQPAAERRGQIADRVIWDRDMAAPGAPSRGRAFGD